MKPTKNFWISLLLGLVLFGGIQYSMAGKFPDPDGFYHAKASQLLTQGNLHDTFPWLYYTTWHEKYANQHFLYHWVLAPFNTVEKLPISVVVYAMLFLLFFLLVLRKAKIGHEIFWTIILLAGASDFLFRIGLVKANTLSLAFLCIIVLLMQTYHVAVESKKRLWSLFGIFLVAAIFVWTYGGFVCVPMLLAAYTTAFLFVKYVIKKDWRGIHLLTAFAPLVASVLGITLGLFAHPDSNHLFKLLYDQLFQTGLGAGLNVPAGNEWRPFNVDWFVKSNILVLLTWSIGFGVNVYTMFKNRTTQERNTFPLWLNLTSLGLMALTLWHRRFIEYWVPFAVLAAAFSFQPYLKLVGWKNFKESLQYWQMKFIVSALLLVIAGTAYFNIKHATDSLRGGSLPTEFAPASLWVKENSNAGDIVFNSQWDQFPQLFYWNDKNYYIVGLDPTFMYIQDEYLYWQWRKVADDKLEDWTSIGFVRDILKYDLKVRYVFIDKNRNPALLNYITTEDFDQKLFVNKFEDEVSVIMEIL